MWFYWLDFHFGFTLISDMLYCRIVYKRLIEPSIRVKRCFILGNYLNFVFKFQPVAMSLLSIRASAVLIQRSLSVRLLTLWTWIPRIYLSTLFSEKNHFKEENQSRKRFDEKLRPSKCEERGKLQVYYELYDNRITGSMSVNMTCLPCISIAYQIDLEEKNSLSYPWT